MSPFSLSYLLQQANIGQSRTSVLNPIQWLLVILVAGIGICLMFHSAAWLVVLFAAMLIIGLVLFFGSYIYFVRTNPDALRSEHFSLSKLAIEKGLVGDSLSGLKPAVDLILSGDPRAMPASPPPTLKEAE